MKTLEKRVTELECSNKALRYELDYLHDIGKKRAKRIKKLKARINELEDALEFVTNTTELEIEAIKRRLDNSLWYTYHPYITFDTVYCGTGGIGRNGK